MRSSRHLVLFSLEKRREWGKFIILFNYLNRSCSNVGVDLFSQATNDRKRENSLNLPQGRFRFFTESVIRYWNKLPRELVE